MFLRGGKVSGAAVLVLLVSCARTSSDPLAEFLKNKQGAVFVFLAPDCPLSQNYTRTLNELRTQFQSQRVEFYAVFPGESAVDDFVATYKITFPIVLDRDFRLADFFRATKTPEVFAVDSNGRAIYQGAIDNWAPELGQHRTVITERYVFDALNSFVRNEPLRIKQTQAVGCFIERRGR
jgi:thiol-disulfide isomerase/thioredoxin